MEHKSSREQSRKMITDGRNLDIVALEKRMTELELFILSMESTLQELINEINAYKIKLAKIINL